ERGREGRSQGGHRKPGKSDYKSKRSFSRNKSIREKSDSSSGRERDGARPDRSGKFKSGDRERFNRSGFKRDERPSRSGDGRKRDWDKPKREGSERSGERKLAGDRDRSRKPGFHDRDGREERKFDRDRPR